MPNWRSPLMSGRSLVKAIVAARSELAPAPASWHRNRELAPARCAALCITWRRSVDPLFRFYLLCIGFRVLGLGF